MSLIPVIAIDGPSASGKGTVAERVALALGYHYLDSGALYRLVAHIAQQQQIPDHDETRLATAAGAMNAHFEGGEVFWEGQPVGAFLRTEACGRLASRVASWPAVRQALLERQRGFLSVPGLVADGRDMASVVFPEARLKVFLTATPECRATRRYNQLMEKGISVIISDLLKDLKERDRRDSLRAVAPLTQGESRLLDTTHLSIEQAVAAVLAWYRELP